MLFGCWGVVCQHAVWLLGVVCQHAVWMLGVVCQHAVWPLGVVCQHAVWPLGVNLKTMEITELNNVLIKILVILKCMGCT